MKLINKLSWIPYVFLILTVLGIVSFIDTSDLPQKASNMLIWIKIAFFLITGICFMGVSLQLYGHSGSMRNKTIKYFFILLALLSFLVGIAFFRFIYYLYTGRIETIFIFGLGTIWSIIIIAIYMRKKISNIEEHTLDFVLSVTDKLFGFLKNIYSFLKIKLKRDLIKIIELVVIGLIIYYVFFSGIVNIDQYLNQNKFIQIIGISLVVGVFFGFYMVAIFILLQIIFGSIFSIKNWLKSKRKKRKIIPQAKTL